MRPSLSCRQPKHRGHLGSDPPRGVRSMQATKAAQDRSSFVGHLGDGAKQILKAELVAVHAFQEKGEGEVPAQPPLQRAGIALPKRQAGRRLDQMPSCCRRTLAPFKHPLAPAPTYVFD